LSRRAQPTARLRDLRPEDVTGAWRLSRLAHWNQREEDWRFLLERNPGRFVAAIVEDRVVGTGGAACYGDALAWVCMILVDPAYRGLGLGAGLTQAVLDRVRGLESVGLDATPAGRPVYAALGFAEHGGWRRLFRAPGTVAAAPAGPSGGASIRGMTEADVPRVAALDRTVFGADRGELLGWMRARAPGSAWVIDGVGVGEDPAAYCFGRPGDHSFQVGPIVAPTVERGRDLLRAALDGVATTRVVVDVMDTREDWRDALRALGFEEERPLTRMYRGAPPAAPRAGWQLAILGPEFG
jgi:GNAT superfamily N-acetyltransferase